MNKRSTPWRLTVSLAAVFLLLAVLLAACGGAGTASQPKGTIKLAENAWTGSSVNVNVAKILLEEKLGYKVEIVTIDENAQSAIASRRLWCTPK